METLLRKVIEATGLSRRLAFTAIRQGRVTVRGRRRTDPSSAYSGGALTLDGGTLATQKPKPAYLLLHKPKGVLTTTTDDRGRETVMDLLPETERIPGLFPVGRLDKDTSGLLILTNDGDLAFRLTHPSQGAEKEYWLRLTAPASDEVLRLVQAGVEVDGKMRRPLDLRKLEGVRGYQLSITIGEGSKRQIRRMFEAVGFHVSDLLRVRAGLILLGDLEEGGWRHLSPQELATLGVAASAKTD